jgi:hypothetical protein
MVLMVKTILLKVDETFFYKMKDDKQRREKEAGHLISWENYIKLLFGSEKSLTPKKIEIDDDDERKILNIFLEGANEE